jgi:uncharacterized protein involved in exopolysaccharide biosynthesis
VSPRPQPAAAAAAATAATAAGESLDAQLQAARERLRVIEAQREAVREQVRCVMHTRQCFAAMTTNASEQQCTKACGTHMWMQPCTDD